MITDKQHELLVDIISNTERPDKLTVSLDKVSRSMSVLYEDMDEEWFKEMMELTPNVKVCGAEGVRSAAGLGGELEKG